MFFFSFFLNVSNLAFSCLNEVLKVRGGKEPVGPEGNAAVPALRPRSHSLVLQRGEILVGLIPAERGDPRSDQSSIIRRSDCYTPLRACSEHKLPGIDRQ